MDSLPDDELERSAVVDSRTIQSTPESGGRAGYDGYKRKNGSKAHIAVDTMGRLLALHVTPSPTSRTGPRSLGSARRCTRRPASRSG